MLGLLGTAALSLLLGDDPRTTKEAMQRVQLVLVGKFRCTGTYEDRKREPWLEKVRWKFRIRRGEYALEMHADRSPFFREGLLEYDLKRKVYRFRATPAKGEKIVYEGRLTKRTLTMEEVKGKRRRLVFILLRFNRYLVRIEERPPDSETWSVTAVVGCTKEGVPFVRGGEGPKCVVTGGHGTIPVQHAGKTYYVC